MIVLTLRQAIRNAIEAENAAAGFYRQMAQRAADPVTRAFFEDMERVEQLHGEEVEELAGRLAVGSLPESQDSDVSMVESAPEWLKADDVALEDAFEVALECENRAALFYDALADHFSGDGSRFFRTLASAEEQHATALRRALQDLRAPARPPLTVGQAVRNAIAAELASATFYRELAARVVDPAARRFLTDMIGVEDLHAAEIEKLSRSLVQGPIALRADMRIESVETAPSWTLDGSLAVEAALGVALQAEQHAARYYAMIATHLEGEDADFFRALSRTEQEHALLIASALGVQATEAA
ncbi:MAG: ferritin family protein [Deltaproteobacteria bacterium]|nr:ferritin family protein [Deltaproteobacteria bacterium]